MTATERSARRRQRAQETRQEIERLRAALEWYADPISYAVTQMREPRSAAHADKGQRARIALSSTKQD